MKNKLSKALCLFLFAAGFGVTVSASAEPDCVNTCVMKYDDCISRTYIPFGVCRSNFENCLEVCGGGVE